MNLFKIIWYKIYYHLSRYLFHSVVKSNKTGKYKVAGPWKVPRMSPTSLSNTDEEIYQLLSKYANLFITIENFKLSYRGNDDFNDFINLPNKVSLISFGDIKDLKGYVIYLECEIKDKYHTKFIFHTENVPYDDPKLVSLIRDKRLSELV